MPMGTYNLHTSNWEAGTLIHETMEFTLPDDIAPGEYALLLSWYDSESALAVFTDERTRVAEEIGIGTILVP